MKPLQPALLLSYFYVGCLTVIAFNIDECSSIKECIAFPAECLKQKPTKCEYLLSYAPSENNSDAVAIELATKRIGNNMYIAVGFSNDQEMGNEPVSTCSFIGDNVTVHLTKNVGKSNRPLNKNPLQLISDGDQNGLLYCKFQQNINKNLSSSSELPDLSHPHFLLIARGAIRNPQAPLRIGIHSLNQDSIDFPQVTPSQVNLSEVLEEKLFGNQSSDEAPNTPVAQPTDYKLILVRLHGLLMILAWLFLLAIGIFSARYMKELWPTTTPMGLKIWFHIHRTLNFVAVCCLVVSTILIFIAKDFSWKGPWFGREQERNLSLGAIHSLVGLLAVIGGVAQPFIALTRCGINHPRRPIFNWIHRIIGLTAFILAAIAIFIAVSHFKRYWADQLWSLISLIVYYLLLIVVVQSLEWYRLAQRPHLVGVEMKTKDGRQNHANLHSSSNQLDNKVKLTTIGSFAVVVLVAGVFTGILFFMLLP